MEKPCECPFNSISLIIVFGFSEEEFAGVERGEFYEVEVGFFPRNSADTITSVGTVEFDIVLSYGTARESACNSYVCSYILRII